MTNDENRALAKRIVTRSRVRAPSAVLPEDLQTIPMPTETMLHEYELVRYVLGKHVQKRPQTVVANLRLFTEHDGGRSLLGKTKQYIQDSNIYRYQASLSLEELSLVSSNVLLLPMTNSIWHIDTATFKYIRDPTARQESVADRLALIANEGLPVSVEDYRYVASRIRSFKNGDQNASGK
jgi:hypothetical protein